MKTLIVRARFNLADGWWNQSGKGPNYLCDDRIMELWELPLDVKAIWLSAWTEETPDRYEATVRLSTIGQGPTVTMLHQPWQAYRVLRGKLARKLADHVTERIYIQCEYEVEA